VTLSSNGIVRPPVLLGTPLFPAVWMFFHPSPYDDFSGELMPIARLWITPHAVQIVLIDGTN
jgi:hypothetical protein